MQTLVQAASAVITDALGRVVLIQRGVEPDRGLWSVPGGRVELGESHRQAAVREALEETGLVVEAGDELWVVTVPTGGGDLYEIHDFACTVVGGDLAAGDDADDARWFAADELAGVLMTAGLADLLVGAGVVAK